MRGGEVSGAGGAIRRRREVKGEREGGEREGGGREGGGREGGGRESREQIPSRKSFLAERTFIR